MNNEHEPANQVTVINDAQSWYEAIKIRRSRRMYKPLPLTNDDRRQLKRAIADISQLVTGVRAVLVEENVDSAFKGIIGSYGKVKKAQAYIAFIGDSQVDSMQARLGYLGEAIILEATKLGLATCWVAGFFKKSVVEEQIKLANSEEVVAITPVGYVAEQKSNEELLMSNMVTSHKRKNTIDLIIDDSMPLAAWSVAHQEAIEAARIAPSAVNRQPWRFSVHRDKIIVCMDSKFNLYRIAKELDCGIAMLHIEVALKKHGINGNWSLTDTKESLEVACIDF